MSERRDARALDRALSGKRTASPQVLALAAVAQQLQGAFDVEVPAAGTTRAMFMQGIGGRGRSWGWLRVFAPATVTALVLLIAMFAGRSALPGETLYPVRQVLKAVGLAPITIEEIDGQISNARELLEDAGRIVSNQPQRAKGMAFEAVKLLGFAEELLPEVAGDEAASRTQIVNSLLARAMSILEVEGSPTDDPRGSDGDEQGVLRDDDDEDQEEDDDTGRGNNGTDGRGPQNDGSNDNRGSDEGPGSGDDEDRSGRNNSGPGDGDDAPDPEDDTAGDDDDTNDGNEGPGGDDGDEKATKDDDGDDDDTNDDNEGPGDGDDDDTVPGAEAVLRGEGRSAGGEHGGGGGNDGKDDRDGNKLDDDDDDDDDNNNKDDDDDVEEAVEELLSL